MLFTLATYMQLLKLAPVSPDCTGKLEAKARFKQGTWQHLLHAKRSAKPIASLTGNFCSVPQAFAPVQASDSRFRYMA